jgi:hypothetical protein
MGLDRYTESTVNGHRTTTPWKKPVDWNGTIMGGGAFTPTATKLDANHILQELGESKHFFE